MNVVIVSALFPPEPVVSARISADLVEAIASEGHKVTVISPLPSRPIGFKYKSWLDCDLKFVSNQRNVRIIRVKSITYPRSQIWGRFLESFSFGWHAVKALKKLSGNIDVVYANTWPLASQAFLSGFCERNRLRLVLHRQDVYPESLLKKLPIIISKLLGPPLINLDVWIGKRTSCTIAISEAMRDVYVYSRGLNRDRVKVVRNWQDDSIFNKLSKREEIFKRYDVQDRRINFMYLGNIGPVAGVDFLIKTFSQIEDSGVQLIIVGGGDCRDKCIELARSLKATNIVFVFDSEYRNVPIIQSMANIFLLPIKRGNGGSSIPSKLCAYMLSGKPIIATVDKDSDTAKCIYESNCGWVGEPEDQAWLLSMIREVSKMEHEVLSNKGMMGRAFGLENLSKSANLEKLKRIICKND